MVQTSVYLSKNFKLSEFLVNLLPSDIDYFDDMALERTKQLAINILQPVRDVFGPVKITSGFRSVRKNLEVGGASNSWHLYGAAADFYCPNANLFEVWCWIQQYTLYNNVVLTELHLYEYHIHVAYVEEDNDRDIKITSGNYPNSCELISIPDQNRLINIYDRRSWILKIRYYWNKIISLFIIFLILLML